MPRGVWGVYPPILGLNHYKTSLAKAKTYIQDTAYLFLIIQIRFDDLDG